MSQSKSHRWIIMLIIVVALGWLGSKAAGLALFAFQPANPDNTSPVLVTVRRGTPSARIAKDLYNEGVIASANRFWRLGSILRKWKGVKAGEYEIKSSMTPLAIFEVLTSGRSVAHAVTVREGLNFYQIADILVAKGLLKDRQKFIEYCESAKARASVGISPPPKSLEGYLFPDTYHLTKDLTLEEIVARMQSRFNKAWLPEYDARARELGLNRHEVITLASIIEKETGAPHERPLISSVFHNRLNKRMRLESDPTTIYGIWKTFNGNLRRHHLKEKNDFNTYAMRGLPAGPIANPGSEAIKAALYPDTSDYLFFVSMNDGTHKFSTNFKDHNKAVQVYQKNRKARKGKSWRDLSKKLGSAKSN